MINNSRAQPLNLLDYETLALQQLSQMAFDYYASGAWDEVTLRDNRAAFDRFRLSPKMLVDVSKRDLTTTIFGHILQFPLLIAPMAFQCLANPEGELATARAAAKAGVGMILSTLATKSIEEVATVGINSSPAPLNWFQLYIHRDRGLTQALIERASSAGYKALCLTVDAPLLGRRERDQRNHFSLPSGMQLANISRLFALRYFCDKLGFRS
jgi:4-hydroxymandelate oxidase